MHFQSFFKISIGIKNPYRGHCDEHKVEAISVAELGVVRVPKVPPWIPAVLKEVAQTSVTDNLKSKFRDK